MKSRLHVSLNKDVKESFKEESNKLNMTISDYLQFLHNNREIILEKSNEQMKEYLNSSHENRSVILDPKIMKMWAVMIDENFESWSKVFDKQKLRGFIKRWK